MNYRRKSANVSSAWTRSSYLARTLDQLESVTNPAYREMLKRTLRALETEIEELG